MVLVIPLRGKKKVVLVPLRVFSFKRSPAGAFAVPIRVQGQQSRGGTFEEDDIFFVFVLVYVYFTLYPG